MATNINRSASHLRGFSRTTITTATSSLAVSAALERQLDADAPQAVFTAGGTGISRRDGSYVVVAGLLEKRLDGFGELFRALSFEETGPLRAAATYILMVLVSKESA